MNKLKQVVALLVAAVHPKCRHIFKSTGLIDAEEYDTLKFIVNQMKAMIVEVRKTNHTKGRASDNKI